MKNTIILPIFIVSLASGVFAGDDCAKSSDACKPPAKLAAPFMEELRKAEKAAALTQGPSKADALKKPASPAERLPAPAAPLPQDPPGRKETFSKPAWLLAVAVMLGGLYCFLKEGKRKRKS
jgi:hypothetical protein